MNIKEIPREEKPREKLMREGSDSLSTVEILALLIGSGTKDKSAIDLAWEVMSLDRNGISFLAEAKPEEIMSISGMGEARTCQLLAAVELGKRIATRKTESNVMIKCSQDIADIFMEKMRYYKKEHFISLMINAKGQIIEETTVSIGDLCSSMTHPREVFVDAVRRSAGSVVFVHNHPSGDPTPSQFDIDTTNRLIEVGELLGIPVLDHLVIGNGDFVSMRASGLI